MVEPGAVLADRYVVEDLLTREGSSQSWRARDRVLARSVVVQTLPSSSPYAPELLSAAKRASRVTDTRILQVLDAVDDGELTYVVREWAAGQSLGIVLSEGPMAARRATWLMREVAAAMTNAHEMGLAHRQLQPENVVVTKSSGIKLVGLGTAAALRGKPSDDDDLELEDTLDLGRLLYACLTARWPGGDSPSLPPAPTEHGRLLRPRQVRAGVPRTLDAVCDRILGQQSRYGEPITRVVDVKDTLSRILSDEGGSLTTGVGLTAPAVRSSQQRLELPPAVLPREGEDLPTGEQAAYGGASSNDSPSSLGRTLMWVAAAVFIVGALLLAYLVGQGGNQPKSQSPSGSVSQSSGATSAGETGAPQPVQIQTATDFDPEGQGGENPDLAPLAIDASASTAWETLSYYGSPKFALLKSGVGLILDLGQATDVTSVDVTLQGEPTSLQLRAAPGSATTAPTGSVDDYGLLKTITDAGTDARFALDQPVRTRFLLVWLTSIPPNGGDGYRGRVADIKVLGG